MTTEETRRARADPATRILAAGLALAVFLLLVRAAAWDFYRARSVTLLAKRAAIAGYYDFAYVFGVTAAFLGLCLLLRKKGLARERVAGAFLAVAVLSLVSALINVGVLEVIRRPLSYQWIYYSDFLRSRDARNAILESLSAGRVLLFATAVAAFLAAAGGLSKGVQAASRLLGPRLLGAASLLAALVYFAVVGPRVPRAGRDRYRLENPVVSFTHSLWVARRSPALWTMKTSAGTEDFAAVARVSAAGTAPRAAGESPVKNVVIFVLESVPAQYLEAYGGRYTVSPHLESHRGQSEVFTNVYAPCSYSPSVLVALLASIYPCISHESVTREHPEFPFPSLSGELKRRGYRTGFFSSADLRFQRTDEFLSHRSFDQVRDYRTFGCGRPVLRNDPGYGWLDGTDDECAALSFRDWLGASRDGSPFFAVLWTMMTHYPYFVASSPIDFGVGEQPFGRYLNALRRGDEALGDVLAELERRGLQDSTLVVVVGDHGESFGEHGDFTHGTNLYEENVHVPFLLINPRLFHGERNPVLGSLIDVAPTVLDLLDVAAPAEWQGRSLWSRDRSPRVYFSNALDEYLVGLREGDRKVIFNASWNRFEIYDLGNDPGETRNRAGELPDVVREGEQRLAAWMQYQRKWMQRVLAARR